MWKCLVMCPLQLGKVRPEDNSNASSHLDTLDQGLEMDSTEDGKQIVAIKMMRKDKDIYLESAKQEIDILSYICRIAKHSDKNNHCVMIHSHFTSQVSALSFPII